MVAAADRTDTVVEHMFALVDAPQKGGDTLLRHVDPVHHLRPLNARPVDRILKVLVELLVVVDGRLVNLHTEFHVVADRPLDGREVGLADRKIRNGGADRATDVSADMIRIHVVGERHGEVHHNVLARMNIGHNAYFRTLEHRMVEEPVDHEQRVLIDIVREDLAVLAISSFKFQHDFLILKAPLSHIA